MRNEILKEHEYVRLKDKIKCFEFEKTFVNHESVWQLSKQNECCANVTLIQDQMYIFVHVNDLNLILGNKAFCFTLDSAPIFFYKKPKANVFTQVKTIRYFEGTKLTSDSECIMNNKIVTALKNVGVI